ncbi:MAG: DHH family phosphoesterase [Promethearchaeota archaeon]|nr:MAG: DHH family phosphoesterase [Candidatus Lokiarchaeota archaeon]
MNPFGISDEFQTALENAAEKLKAWISPDTEIIRVSSHIDADGIAAAGIICTALDRLGAHFHLRILRQLEPQYINSLVQEKNTCYIFSDFGSGQLHLLAQAFPSQNVLILDHHEPLNLPKKPKNIIEINPHLFKVNGSIEISGAGVSFLLAYFLDPKLNLDLLPLALVGAIGDTQDKAKQHTLLGLNAKIAELGVKETVIQIEKDLYFQYSEIKPISKAISETTDPYLPHLTGNEDACVRFLGEVGIPLQAGQNWRTLSDLTTEEKRLLTTQLTQQILSHNGTSEQASAIIGTNYKILAETESYLKDARSYSSLLNACGRTRNPGIGVAVCLGDRAEHYRRAQDLLIEYQTRINTLLEKIKHPGIIQESDYVQYFVIDESDETLVGTIATISSKTKLAKPSKPILGFAKSEENTYKISARASDTLIKKGLHLGLALRKTLSELQLDKKGFLAGGHDAAAGGRIPISEQSAFIETLNKIIKQQIDKQLVS